MFLYRTVVHLCCGGLCSCLVVSFVVCRACDSGCYSEPAILVVIYPPMLMISITVVGALDDGCQHPKHVELSTDV